MATKKYQQAFAIAIETPGIEVSFEDSVMFERMYDAGYKWNVQRGEWVHTQELPLSLWSVLPLNYKPRTPAFKGGAVEWWNSRDPWATAREYRRRKDEIRALYRGE